MKHHIHQPPLLLFLIFLLTLHTELLSADVITFKPLATSSNLPTNEVRNLYQDNEGYIWISTYNGLLRFDGYSTVVYRPDGENKDRNIDGFVNIVAEDKEHRLWIGTHSGLYVLDQRMDRLEKVVSPLLQVSYIEAIACTKNGEVWVGANKGIFRRKAGSNNFELCDPQFQKNDNRPHYDVKSIIEDKNGHIWIGTWEQGLLRYDPNTDHYYTYQTINPSQSAHTLFQDNHGNIWIGTWRYGLAKMERPYDMDNYSLKYFVHDPNNPQSLCDNIIYTITQDQNSGKLWIGSRSGLSILESEEGKGIFSNYLPGKGSESLPFNEVDALMCTRDGLMWIGMLGGGVYTANTRRQLFDYDPVAPLLKRFSTSSIRSACPTDGSSVFMGVMGYGLVEYDAEKQKIIHYKQHPGFSHMPYISTVNDIIRLQNGKYCFATWDDGIWMYDGRKAYAINQQTHPALTDVCIYSLHEDKQGNLWIGTRNGLCMLDCQGKMWPIDKLAPDEKYAWPQVPIFKIVEDAQGNIWTATPNSGIWRITPHNGHYSGKIYDNNRGNSQSVGALTLCADSQNRVWAGTNGNGLDLYDTEKDRFISVYSTYFEPGDVVFSMLEDNDGGLWLTTNSKMYYIENLPGKQSHIYTYTMEEGLQDHIFNRNACFKQKDGTLFFGGTHGLNSFHPETIRHDSISYPTVITDLRLYETSIRNLSREEQNSLLDAPLDYASHIVLPYNKNNFSLDFSILSYINPQLNKYQYQLEGYDANWVSTNALRHFAYYNNLPAGDYTFRVKGANPNGVWSAQERILHITILPPPWLSWWAYCLYLLLAATFAWFLYRTIRKRIRMQHTIELGNLQRQKLEEINHAKLQFFTNITHELLTPLSIISASVDELKIQYPELSQRLRSISDNSLRLIRLIQQILEFRKVENGKQRLRVSRGNLTLFLKQSANAFTPLVRKKQLHIVLENSDPEIYGYFDPDKLDKIVYNLLSNAAKYTQDGRFITIKQSYVPDQGTYTFSVNNPGEIIPPDRLSHLFERFYEGEYRKFHTIGTGIGLSLTKDLVTLHHGEIRVTSAPETGNTFTVTLPIVREAYTQEEIEDNPETVNETEEIHDEEVRCPDHPNLPHAETGDGERPSILLVEDNEDLRETMRRLLERHYHVSEADNGQTALKILEIDQIDLVVSDVMMPEMDGMELCRLIKSQFGTAHIPVILLTARTTSQDRIEGYDAGADGYICKPLDFPVLIAKIENLLKSRKQTPVDARKKLVFEAKEISYTPDDEQFLKKATECVNSHLNEQDFDLSKFVSEMGMSRSTLNDKLKQLTGMTPLAFISNIRLQAAFRLLEENRKIRINDLAFKVGFNDPKYFTLCFRKKFGVSPKEYLAQKEEENTR